MFNQGNSKMDIAATTQSAPAQSRGILGTVKFVTTLSVIAGLLTTNVATLTSDVAHTSIFDGLKQAMSYALPDNLANRFLTHSPTAVRQGDVIKATAKLAEQNKNISADHDDLKGKHQKLTTEHADLNIKHSKLSADHNDLTTKHKTVVQLQEKQAAAAKKVSARIAPRIVHTATRSVSSLPARAAPFAGAAISVGMTVWEINDMCETLKDMNELNSAFGHPQIDPNTVCGIRIPGT